MFSLALNSLRTSGFNLKLWFLKVEKKYFAFEKSLKNLLDFKKFQNLDKPKTFLLQEPMRCLYKH